LWGGGVNGAETLYDNQSRPCRSATDPRDPAAPADPAHRRRIRPQLKSESQKSA
jgi:hypothetical protein